MNSDLYTIVFSEPNKAEKLVHILDNMGILVSSKCRCITANGKRKCQYGPGWQCERGYVITVPRKDRETMVSVANAVDTVETG